MYDIVDVRIALDMVVVTIRHGIQHSSYSSRKEFLLLLFYGAA